MTSSLFPLERPAQRLDDWRFPARAASNQGWQAKDAGGRGALIGRVGGWITTRGVNAAKLDHANSPAPPRAISAVPLATTDGIYAALTETTGFIGFLTVLISSAAILTVP